MSLCARVLPVYMLTSNPTIWYAMCDTICNAIYGDKDTQYVPNLTMSFMILRLWVNTTYDIDLEHINWIGGGQVLGGKHDIKESRR